MDVDEVVAAVAGSRRYRSVSAEVVRRLAAGAVERDADPVKATKRALHQVFGAFLPQRPRFGRLLRDIGSAADPRDALARAMAGHASTRERLPFLAEFHHGITGLVGPVSSVIDIGCGLHPLSAPWMGLSPGSRYTAIEIDAEVVDFVAAVLTTLGLEADARVGDALHPPADPVDLALALKLLPTLDHQQVGAGWALLDALRARHLVVSFPTGSLGGRAYGRGHTDAFEAGCAARGWRWQVLRWPNEAAYVVGPERLR